MNISKTIKPVANVKNLIFSSLATRLIKFILGVILFFIFLIPAFSKLLSNHESIIVDSGLLATMFIWIFVTFVNRVLTIVYIVKVSLPNKIFMNIEPNSAKSQKLSVIRITAIIGFFIPFFDVFSMLMFLVFANNLKKESLDNATPKIA
ncbi:hypothetical protein R7U59_01250 [Mesomycoplasma ovipneumoniae]|uniref:Uncharacterized protein n=1 Tax=Mesomycoplasma ovipneumoniae TaxID=29562 RepID=A0AAJ2UD62_9BACT|nr:hypothetical protein [Mesomycoplasma ovipneumoniae]MDW2835476.1 hypothetical protein [Mesomycoplasma ovipneumoniae]MDW2862012.1 hypothetical protein [Mesomycoplasma ovipneumoniae]MDW2891663.1 hypothetical protein [Mesomycoplasma ovipneumoniae]MDW2898025.1 hypothetical protein [Mesomycoplasma ovipneumoniae]